MPLSDLDRYLVRQNDVTRGQYEEFARLVSSNAGERNIEAFLAVNQPVLALSLGLFTTGQRRSWIVPKKQIRPNTGYDAGLIPDYIAVGENSDGLQYFFLELKGADKPVFAKSGANVRFSRHATAGLGQLSNYIDVASRDQAYLRDTLALPSFREPTGVLLIGREDESADPHVMQAKAAWNRANPRCVIRSYDRFLRHVKTKVRTIGRMP